MKAITVRRVLMFVIAVFSMSLIFGCANYEVNTKRGKIPGQYIRYEMQEADRAIDAAQQAGKDKLCPAEFKAAQDARDHAYDVFRSCHTEEGAALAKQATAKANALCPAEARLKPRAEGKLIVVAFEDIHFDFDKSTLKPEAQAILKRDVRKLKENPKARIRIAGYTSASGTEDYNQGLSERRANAVRDYLIKEGGVSPDRLTIVGYGETHPAEYEAAPKEIYSKAAKANMRVLFEIVVQ